MTLGLHWRRSTVEVALEGIHVRRPISAERLHPSLYFLQRLRPNAIEAALRVDRRLDEAGVSQHTQMLRDRRLREIERRLEVANGTLAFGEESQDGAPIGLGEDSEHRFH